jgi:hypothetical protein
MNDLDMRTSRSGRVRTAVRRRLQSTVPRDIETRIRAFELMDAAFTTANFGARNMVPKKVR